MQVERIRQSQAKDNAATFYSGTAKEKIAVGIVKKDDIDTT